MNVLIALLAAVLVASDTRQSGADFMGASTRAMQHDDTQNPAMLWVGDGQALWTDTRAGNGKSCASCHGDARTSMRGVAARYPAFDSHAARVLNLGQRIASCRQRRQDGPALPAQGRDALALESYVALQSRGMPVAPPAGSEQDQAVARGKAAFFQRIGQLNLSCAQCHDDNWGKRLGGSTIPQGHASAYPVYRLEWQDMGSLQRRLRNCMSGVRAEPAAYGAQELVDLEAYLAARAKGMAMEAPGVRP